MFPLIDFHLMTASNPPEVKPSVPLCFERDFCVLGDRRTSEIGSAIFALKLYYLTFLKVVITENLPSSMVVNVLLDSICLSAFQAAPLYSPVFSPETQMFPSPYPTNPRHPVSLTTWVTSRLPSGIKVWFPESETSSCGPPHSPSPALGPEFIIWS